MSALKHGQQWTTRELAHVREFVPRTGVHAVAVALGRSDGAVRSFAAKYGIRPPPAPSPSGAKPGSKAPKSRMHAGAGATDIERLWAGMPMKRAVAELGLPAGVLALHYGVPISRIWALRREQRSLA